MIEPVDSQTDPAGKQYRASTAKAVNVGNGVQIPQGTPATVVLAQGPNGWSTQLTSLTVEGQAIAVTSSSASVTSAAQSAAATAANTVGSVFGGFGRRAPPAAVTAVATGQRVVLPPGVTLTFIVATPGSAGGAAPSANATPAANPAPEATAVAAAVPTPSLASSPTAAPGQHWFLCTYPQAKDPAKPILGSWMYYSEFSAIPDLGKGMVDGFDAYVQQKYKIDTYASGHTSGFSNCRRISDDSAARANSMDMFLKQWASSNIEAVRTDWTYTPGTAPAASTAPAPSPAASPAPGPAPVAAVAANGRYVFCFTGHPANPPTNAFTNATEPVTYFSEVFPEPNIGLHVTVDWNAFLQKASMPQGACQDRVGLSLAQTGKQQMEDARRNEKKQIVETGWKYTP